ncbi:hypothetical protein SAMN05428963_11971 [Consotaella salsifontis]|uniref:Uncharacterized protein n=2 Tax=Consotaella salsifontis TaxID=1365950 RepID=A0A1T4T5R3_9HYPH|nr:hypothetical protein SAMN05428963_11971 [Consotaella salsifontis]
MQSMLASSRSPRPSVATSLLAMCAVVVSLSTLPANATQSPRTPPDYRDDRSTAESVVRSLYNAVNRHEYLRAYSYFSDGPERPDFETFSKGYEATEHVRLKLGKAVSEGAAGSIYTRLPVAIEAIDSGGAAQVYAGCYTLRLAQPAAQATPPFQPLSITEGTLKPVDAPFDSTSGSCPTN